MFKCDSPDSQPTLKLSSVHRSDCHPSLLDNKQFRSARRTMWAWLTFVANDVKN
jgi:hypothetical protein